MESLKVFAGWWRRLFPDRPRRLLFVGNSLTYFEEPAARGARVLNDLPGLLADLSARAGLPLETARITADGASLQAPLASGRFGRELAAGPWDFVILQENSERILAEEEAARRDIRRMSVKISSAGARTVLLSTPSAAAVYRRLAGELGGILAPAGEAWALALRRRPEIRLTLEDGIHPSSAGSYLSACVLYAALFREEPPAAVEGEEPGFLRAVAWEAVRPDIQPSVAGGHGGPGE